MQRADVRSFLQGGPSPVIDVRSPAEFARGHIPGAVNIPLLNDGERHEVGKKYVQTGREQAIELGLELVGPKMAILAQSAKSLSPEKHRRVYCWRGGMRSEKMAWLFELTGLNCTVLNGGYKAYRQAIMERFAQIKKLILIQGPTGSGKTEILLAMKELGLQVIDLEGLARHKGSAFGHLGQLEQPTSQQFQNDIFDILRNYNLSMPVFVEAESANIGKVSLPDPLWAKMKISPVIHIDIAREARLAHLLEMYGHFPVEELIESTRRIAGYLGGKRLASVLESLEQGDIPRAVGQVLEYYDTSYERSRRHHLKEILFTYHSAHFDPSAAARFIAEKLNQEELLHAH